MMGMEELLVKKARILVVEDEGLVAAQIREALEGLGYDVPAVAATGANALERFAEMEPDLVLMDIQLKGGMSGIETAQRMRTRLDVPVVYLTAFSDTETLEEAKLTDPLGYVLKPFDERSLHATIQMALHRHERARGSLESGRWASAVAASMSDAVLIADPKGLVTFVNPAAEALFGRRKEELGGERIADAVTVLDGATGSRIVLPVSEPLAEGRSALRGDCRVVGAGGGETPVEVSASPLRGAEGTLFGLLYVFRQTSERERVQHLVLRELEGLAHLAKRNLPARDARLPGCRVDWLFHPSELSGGDVIGFAALDASHAGFWAVDVIGQGVTSALFSLLLHSVLSTDAERGGILVASRCEEPRRQVRDPADVVRELNRRFYLEQDRNPFFTLAYGVLDADKSILTLVRAGHPHPLLVRSDGVSRVLRPEGFAIGLFPQAEAAVEEVRFAKGDRLLLYSDGLVDTTKPAGERYGSERLADLARRHREAGLRETIEAIDADVLAFRGGAAFADDVSLLVVERT
jgi:PAS domain S-box-containing protein